MPKRPSDLISVREATKLVDRSVSSVRAWIRADDLHGYREKEGKKTSRLMVSRAELLLYMGGADKPVNPPRTTPEQTETDHRIALLEAELVAERSTLAATKTTLAALEGQSTILERLISTERERANEWKDRAEALDAENRALRVQAGLPWWRRLLTTGAPALPGPVEAEAK